LGGGGEENLFIGKNMDASGAKKKKQKIESVFLTAKKAANKGFEKCRRRN